METLILMIITQRVTASLCYFRQARNVKYSLNFHEINRWKSWDKKAPGANAFCNQPEWENLKFKI